MASKYDIAQYLVNLHSLLQAQDQVGGVLKSTTLVNEYNSQWDVLKEAINKENDDEARNSEQQSGRSEAGTDRPRDQSSGRISDRPSTRKPA